MKSSQDASKRAPWTTPVLHQIDAGSAEGNGPTSKSEGGGTGNIKS